MAESRAQNRALAGLYREEAITHGGALGRGLLRLESLLAEQQQRQQSARHNTAGGVDAVDAVDAVGASGAAGTSGAAGAEAQELVSLLRAAHSLKGAARIMRLNSVAQIAHELEEVFVLMQKEGAWLDRHTADVLLAAVDFLVDSAAYAGAETWPPALETRAHAHTDALRLIPSRLRSGRAAFLRPCGCPETLGTGQSGQGLPGAGGASGRVPAAATEGIGTQTGFSQPSLSAASSGASGISAASGFAGGGSVGADPSLGVSAGAAAGDNRFGNTDNSGDGGGELVLRIRLDQANEMLRLGAQGRLLSRRLDQLPQVFFELSAGQLALERRLDTLAGQLGEHGVDAALRSQLLAPLREQSHRLRQMQESLREHAADCVQEQALLSERWYAQVLACRTRPLADIVSGFPRLVRDMAHSLGKEISLNLEGTATLADREILEKLETPLAHLLRNACSHGLETAEQRLAAGKPRQGSITLLATHRDGWLEVSVRDDGRGIATPQVREYLEHSGRVGSAALLSDQAVWEYLFEPGLSTAQAVDTISGRGIGLDAVRTQVHELGGQVFVSSVAGRGATFTLRVPITRALLRVLCVRLGSEPYALPLGQIDSLIGVTRAQAASGFVELGGASVPIICLATLLGLPPEPTDAATVSTAATAATTLTTTAAGAAVAGGRNGVTAGGVATDIRAGAEPAECLGDPASAADSRQLLRMVVLQLRTGRCVLNVGSVEDELELVVHSLDARLGELPLFQSTGLNEQGEVVLVLDIGVLCERIAAALAGKLPPASALLAHRLRVLLAEDTEACRSSVTKLLEQAGGIEVCAVASGREAWEKLSQQPEDFDLLVTDLEMPHMDGWELIGHVRNAAAPLQSLPILILSAMENAEQWGCALAKGGDRYLSKTLLETDPDAFVAALRSLALERRRDG